MKFEAGWKRGLPKRAVALWHRDESGIVNELVLQSVLIFQQISDSHLCSRLRFELQVSQNAALTAAKMWCWEKPTEKQQKDENSATN